MMQLYWCLLLLIPVLDQASSAPASAFIRVLPQDCHELFRSGVNRSGVYTIYPTENTPVDVYCDMGCEDDKSRGWTVIQRRMDGSVNFFRLWDQYRNGFGNKSSEYWLGLENMNLMTHNKHYELRVELEDFQGAKAYAQYTTFSVGSEENGYPLTVYGFIDGGAGDSLYYHNGAQFSTFDRDHSYYGCAYSYLSGFWFTYCHLTNPNGIYFYGNNNYFGTGVMWYSWRYWYYSLKSITMMIRPIA